MLFRSKAVERVRIYDVKGKLILQECFAGEPSVKLNIEGIEAGFYTLEIFANREKAVRHFIKN